MFMQVLSLQNHIHFRPSWPRVYGVQFPKSCSALYIPLPYFALWDYGGVWGASVSSQFNYLIESMVRRPFFTWADFTVAGYLAASLAVEWLLLAACYRQKKRELAT